MAYTKTSWRVGEPITQERMNHIEQGIEDAHNDINLRYTKSEIESMKSELNENITAARTVANEALSTANTAQQGNQAGQDAWTAVSGAMEFDEQGNITKTLAARLANDERTIAEATNAAAEAKQWINDAKVVGTVLKEGRQVTAESLAEKVADIDRKINDVTTTANGLATTISPLNDRSFGDRLTALDANTTPSMNVPEIITEISNARGQNSQGGNNTNLSQRFSQDEARLNAIDDNTTPIRTLPNIITEINDSHRSLNDTLDARFDSIDGGAAPSRTLPDVITEISNAHRSAVQGDTLNQRFNSLDTDIATINANLGYNDLSSTETIQKKINDAVSNAQSALEDRIDAIDNSTTGTVHQLDERVNALETEVDMTNVNSRIDLINDEVTTARSSTTTSNTYDSLDARLEAIESAAVSTDNNINTIAQELSMINSGEITNTATRIDTLEENLQTINTDINDRIDTLEDTITDEDTGLAATKAIADAAKATADTALQPADIVTLTNDVTTLKNKDTTYTQVINNATYDNNGKPQINDPSENIDYLIKGAGSDDKYYYWKYIKVAESPITYSWELISGAGGEGTGNSNAEDYASYADFTSANPEENKDYYVLEEDGVRHHYRYLKTTVNNEDTWTLIEIGTIPSNIKRYNIEKITKGEKSYLRLYEFEYGTGNTITIETTADDWVPSTAYELNSQVLYDGYFYSCITANTDEEWTPSHWERLSDMRAVTSIELPQGGGGAISGAVTRFIRLAPTSITTIQNNDPIYIHFFYSCVDPNAGSFEGNYVLSDQNGSTLATGSINSGEGTGSITSWPQDHAEGQIYNDGYGSIDVAPYCVLGVNTFSLKITTGTNESFTRTWTVDIKQLNIESSTSDSLLQEINKTIDIAYTPYGAMSKLLIVKIDGVQVKTESLGAGISGTEQTCTIPAQSVAGAHTITLQLSAQINGETKYSSSIVKDCIWYDPEDTSTIIISSPYRGKTLEFIQYSEIVIPYTIYKANTNSFNVEYYYNYDENGTNVPFDTVSLNNTNSGSIRYIPTEASSYNESTETYVPDHITIKVEDTMVTFDLIVTPMSIDIAPVAGAVIDFNPATLNNNSANRLPSYLSVSDNFNWSTNWEGENQDSGGGYRTDEDGKCFVIKAGTYAEIDYQMFKQHNVDAGNGTTITTSSVFDTGAEMKLIFKVTNVRDASTIWFTNMGNFVNTQDEDAKKVGIELKAHEGWLKTDKASDKADTTVELPAGYVAWSKTSSYTVGDVVVYKAIIYQCIKDIAAPATGEENSWNKKAWQSLGQLETEISATNSYLYFPYSEEDKIELDININKHGNNQNFIMSYEDGVPSKAYPYGYSTGGDILYHVLNNESKIHIGSPDCDVHIYRLRIYNKSLTTNEILKNFIADGETINERIARYDRNSIYYSPELNDGEGGYTPYKTGAATLDPYRLAERIPDVKVLMLEAPRFTTGKKDFVKGTTLRCIQAAGGKVYPANLNKDNWYFFNGYHAGQGTTSDNYGQSARNVDFLFECDGSHAPTKTGNLSANEWIDYVSELAQGADASVYNQTEKSWSVAPGVTTSKCQDWMGDDCKVSLTHFNMNTKQVTNEATSIPNNYFNLKVNVASSENVNNALFQKRYNDFLPYTSPAKNRDSRIKNGMEFVPAVLFIRENDTDLSTHKEFNDTEWHFYALGNLGDSKKTDYTRAYDPTDMNEFTIEISDNNTANSQFQSGVFLSDPTDSTSRTVETQAMADDPNIDQDPMKYVYAISDAQWNASREPTAQELEDSLAARGGNDKKTDVCTAPNDKVYVNYRHYTLTTEPFDGDHSFEFRYACCGHYRDGDLINPYDEEDPQYAIDTAQGETNRKVWEAFYSWIVTATDEQFRNEATLWFVPSAVEFFYAFTHYYTMMDNRAKNTFWHFAKTGTRRAIPIGRAVPALFHIYEESDGTGGYQPASGTFDNTKQYYTQYAFDLWVYDTDTACGIDNNGELSFPYGKEDTDYRVAGQPTSGWAFNGSGSIFWRRLSATFESDISALMRQEDTNCFSTAQHLINQFDEFQNCFPEEIWRLDIERKYIRTFTGAVMDNSINQNKQNIRFLRAMMQGRKKYQRRQWVRNQAVYFGSKYGLNNVRTAEHTIEFNIYTPSSDGVTELAVPVDQSQLVIKPYQDMYIDVAVGNSTTNLSTQDFKRAKAGERVVVDCRSGGSAQETRVYIFGGEHIAALENLAPMYTYSGSFGQGKHLKVLDLGSDNPNYNNPRFTSISINENMPLLETFSVKNCNRLAQSIDLHLSNNLRTFEAEGSLITGVTLPAYTNIETLHLPTTVTSVSLNSARSLDDFYIKNKSTGEIDYSNLITLNVNDSDYSENVDWIDIARQTLNEKINMLYLQNLYTALITDISDLEDFEQKKKALEVNYGDDGQLIKHIVLSGLLKVTGEWSEVEKEYYAGTPSSVWPGLTLDTSEGTEVTRYKIVYKYDDSTKDGEEIYSTYITPTIGSDTITIPEIYSNTPGTSTILQSPPTKDSTKEYYYIFGALNNSNQYTRYSGWRYTKTGNVLTSGTAVIPINEIVNNTVTLEAVFNHFPMSYPIHWYLNENDVSPAYTTGTVTIEYGKSYNGHIPNVQDLVNANKTLYTMTGTDPITYKIFNGWQTTPINLTLTDEEAATTNPAYKIYAKWYEGTKSLAEIRDSAEYSPEKLLLFSQSATLRSNSAYFSTNKRYDITMGYDGLDGGTQITPFLYNNTYHINTFSGDDAQPYVTNISPLSATNNAFTLVLDYQFDTNYVYSNSISEAVLVGCYERNNNTVYGFKLYFDPNNMVVRVGFGDTANIENQTRIIADGKAAQYRNIIVLRHAHNDPTLYIYSGIRYNAGAGLNAASQLEVFNSLDADNLVQTLDWNSISTEAKLVFGDLAATPVASTTITNGRGKIFWAKYWNYDVGNGECRMLAAWPHETITFGVQDYNGMNGTRVIPMPTGKTQPNIVLTSLSTSSYIGPIYKTIYDETYNTGDLAGWHNSWYRTFSNNRIFFGLPITLQSILSKTNLVCRQEQSDGIKFVEYRGDPVQVMDYVFFPGYTDIYPGNDELGQPYNAEGGHTYYWNINSAITRYAFIASSHTFSTNGDNTDTKQYMNMRFPYIALAPSNNRVFTGYDYTAPVSTIIPNLRRGDVFTNSANIPFIYVTSDDVINGAPVIENTGIFYCAQGGWVRGEYWQLRSIVYGDYGSNKGSHIFMFVRPNGVNSSTSGEKMSSPLPNYNQQSNDVLASSAIGACLCYSFGI